MNISNIVKNYIERNPSIKHSVINNLINYSKLARLIEKENNIKAFDAILIAIRRYYQNNKNEKSSQKKIKEILEKSSLEIKNKIVAIVVEKNIHPDTIIELQKKSKKDRIYIIWGIDSTTLICSSEILPEITAKIKSRILSVIKDLIMVIIRSPPEIQNTPGVIGYIFSQLGSNEINIEETLSCWTDTIFVIKEKYLNKTIEILKF
jgi:aspartokinase